MGCMEGGLKTYKTQVNTKRKLFILKIKSSSTIHVMKMGRELSGGEISVFTFCPVRSGLISPK